MVYQAAEAKKDCWQQNAMC